MGETVLVVDDTPVNQKLLTGILRRSGHSVQIAADGIQALASVAASPPDLILLDVMMPGKDGFTVCAELKANPATADIPIIFLSAMGEVADKVKGLELGAADYIAKPFDSAEVLARTNTQLRLRRLTQSLVRANQELTAKTFLLEEDLRAAADVQRALIPQVSPRLRNLSVSWVFEPCSSIGGDIFNVLSLDPRHVGIYMLDVAGHGVPPAMVSVLASQSLTPTAGIVVRPPEGAAPLLVSTPAEVLRALDREYPIDRFERFFTISYLVLEVETGFLTYSSAGHPPPILMTAGGEMRLLEEGGGIIGVGDPLVEMGELTLHKGDRVFLYTDGITEYEDDAQELYGRRRLHEVLEDTRGDALAGVCESLRASLVHFGRGAAPRDDVSLLAFEYLGERLAMAYDIALHIESRLESVALVGAAVNAIGGCLGFGETERADIELCVVEAVSNSVRHAYRGEAGHEVTVEVRLDGEGLEIRVLDQGLPVPAENRIPREPDFDPEDIASIPEGGRGTFLMHSLMDSVTYGLEGGSNVLVLKRERRRGV